MVTPTRPAKLGPFNLGVNNRLPDTELTIPKVGTFLRAGANVDVTSPGILKRRQGFTESLAGTDCHSFWSDDARAYVVDGTTLFCLTGSPTALVKAAVRSGLTPGARLSYTDVGGRLVYSDGSVLRCLEGASDKPLGVPLLDPQPVVSAGSTGALPAGKYQLCFTYLGDDLQQSGSTTPVQLDVAEGQGIVITGLPAAFPAGIAGIAVYMTPVNGDQLLLAQMLSAPQASLTVATSPQLGGRCQTLLLKPMPAGSIVRHNNGRLLVATGSFLTYSDPYALSLQRPEKNFIPFPSAITVVESVKTGTYVATLDKTYFFAGDIAEATADEVLPYGAVPGTGGTSPDRLKCWWMSTRGLIQAAGGEVKNVQEDAIAMNKAALGASLFREQDGIKQVVTSLFGTEASGAAAYSFMDGEIVRKGTVL